MGAVQYYFLVFSLLQWLNVQHIHSAQRLALDTAFIGISSRDLDGLATSYILIRRGYTTRNG